MNPNRIELDPGIGIRSKSSRVCDQHLLVLQDKLSRTDMIFGQTDSKLSGPVVVLSRHGSKQSKLSLKCRDKCETIYIVAILIVVIVDIYRYGLC